jgi:hypothetical protein
VDSESKKVNASEKVVTRKNESEKPSDVIDSSGIVVKLRGMCTDDARYTSGWKRGHEA